MRIVVLEENLIILPERSRPPPSEVEPCLGIQGVSVAGVSMLIHSRRDTTILVGGLSRKPIEDDSESIRPLRKLSIHTARVDSIIHIDVDHPWHRGQVFACVVE